MGVGAAVGEGDELGECVGSFGAAEEGGVAALVAFVGDLLGGEGAVEGLGYRHGASGGLFLFWFWLFGGEVNAVGSASVALVRNRSISVQLVNFTNPRFLVHIS